MLWESLTLGSFNLGKLYLGKDITVMDGLDRLFALFILPGPTVCLLGLEASGNAAVDVGNMYGVNGVTMGRPARIFSKLIIVGGIQGIMYRAKAFPETR